MHNSMLVIYFFLPIPFAGGRLDRHFMIDACPVFHNTNRKECKDMRAELNKKVSLQYMYLSNLGFMFT